MVTVPVMEHPVRERIHPLPQNPAITTRDVGYTHLVLVADLANVGDIGQQSVQAGPPPKQTFYRRVVPTLTHLAHTALDPFRRRPVGDVRFPQLIRSARFKASGEEVGGHRQLVLRIRRPHPSAWLASLDFMGFHQLRHRGHRARKSPRIQLRRHPRTAISLLQLVVNLLHRGHQFLLPKLSDIGEPHHFASVSRIQYILRYSLAKTLAHKYRRSMTEIFRKHGGNLRFEWQLRNGERKSVAFAENTDWTVKTDPFVTRPPDLDLLGWHARLRTRSKLGVPVPHLCGVGKGGNAPRPSHPQDGGTKADRLSRRDASPQPQADPRLQGVSRENPSRRVRRHPLARSAYDFAPHPT
jgi:hypothetical protein